MLLAEHDVEREGTPAADGKQVEHGAPGKERAGAAADRPQQPRLRPDRTHRGERGERQCERGRKRQRPRRRQVRELRARAGRQRAGRTRPARLPRRPLLSL